MGEKKEGEDIRVILFPLPLEGHTNPMLHLADILYSKGFSITIIHTNYLNSLHPSNHPNFTFRSIVPDEAEPSGGGGVLRLITVLNRGCVEAFRKSVAELVAEGSNHIGCLITDTHWYFTQQVADEFGIRRIVLRTANVSAFLAMLALPALRPIYLSPSSSETSLEDPLPNFPHLRFKDLPAMMDQSPHLIDQILSSLFIQTKASSAIIFNSFDHLEPDPLLKCFQLFSPIPIFSLGPFHKHLPLTPQPHSSLSWLNTKPPKSVLYVSFGTLATVESHDFVEIAWGLANSSHPFLWVVRPGMVRGYEWLELLPEGFEEMVGERGLIVKWAPQREVLAHPAIGGFWTHNGWNSTIESICEGVPMLCYPCFGDQKANARYVTHVWGIGVMLGDHKLERGEIEKGIAKLMAEKENGEIMKRIKDLKEKADSCVKEGGSTFKSLDNLVNFILKK